MHSENPSMSFLKLQDGTQLWYDYQPSHKTTIVFVHGWPLNHTCWNKQVEYLHQQGYGTVRFDMRGHGQSVASPSSSLSIDEFSEDLRNLLEHLEVHKPVVLGHSLGGMVVLGYLQKYQDVCAIGLIDTADHNPTRLAGNKMAHSLHAIKSLLAHHGEMKGSAYDFSHNTKHYDTYFWWQGVKHTDLRVVAMDLADILSFNAIDVADHITVPTLIMVGANDTRTPPILAKKMHERIVHSQLVIIPGCSHDSIMSCPDVVNQHLSRFIGSL